MNYYDIKDKDRFDLEQQIMSCWSVVDDLETVFHHERLYNNEDDMMNVLIGLKTMYQIKFEKLWDTFEKNKDIKW